MCVCVFWCTFRENKGIQDLLAVMEILGIQLLDPRYAILIYGNIKY